MSDYVGFEGLDYRVYLMQLDGICMIPLIEVSLLVARLTSWMRHCWIVIWLLDTPFVVLNLYGGNIVDTQGYEMMEFVLCVYRFRYPFDLQ